MVYYTNPSLHTVIVQQQNRTGEQKTKDKTIDTRKGLTNVGSQILIHYGENADREAEEQNISLCFTGINFDCLLFVSRTKTRRRKNQYSIVGDEDSDDARNATMELFPRGTINFYT